MGDLLLRVFGVVRKEIVEIIRQPGLVAILVIGPLGILLLFGSGVRPTDPAVTSVFVAPEGNEQLAEVVESYAGTQTQRLDVQGVTTDAAAAEAQLRRGEIDLIVIFPDVSMEELRTEERQVITARHRFIDPLEAQAIRLFTTSAVDDLNDILVALAIGELQVFASEILSEVEPEDMDDPEAGRLLDDVLTLDPAVIAAPLEGEAESIGGQVTTSQFYAPAVVALILQHLTITFVALSVSRERRQGTTELFAVSPLRPVEHVAGRLIAYVAIGAVLGAIMMVAVTTVLGAPTRGGIGPVALVLVLLLLASIGMGVVLAALARTTTQVVQGAMLLLLLSVFFGGLLLSPERLLPWARPIGWILPMTHGLEVLRDSMLRGVEPSALLLGVLAGQALVFTAIALWLARRTQRRL
jgi:ABC-2 type transport system permease protein